MPGCLIQTTLSNTPQCFRQGFETWLGQKVMVQISISFHSTGSSLKTQNYHTVDTFSPVYGTQRPILTLQLRFILMLSSHLQANTSSDLSRNRSDGKIPKLLPQFLRILKAELLGIAASQPVTPRIMQSGSCSLTDSHCERRRHSSRGLVTCLETIFFKETTEKLSIETVDAYRTDRLTHQTFTYLKTPFCLVQCTTFSPGQEIPKFMEPEESSPHLQNLSNNLQCTS
jgi:hypothetical protein